jgi:hypothetical protein
MNVGLEPSIGRKCKIGTISWPRLRRKQFRLQLRAAHSVIQPARAAIVPNFQRQSDRPRISRRSDEGVPWLILAIAIKHLASMAGNRNSFCTAKEPSDGRALLEASLGQNGHRMGGVTPCK